MIAVACAMSVCGMGFGLTFPLLSLTLESWGISETLIGANASMFALAALTFSPFVPKLLSRYGARAYLQTAIAITVVCLLSFKAIPNVWAWFPLRYIAGATINSMFIVGEVWIMSMANANARGRTVAIFSIALSGGFALGPALLMVTGTQGWLPFVAGAVVLSLGIIPLFWANDIAPKQEGPPLKNLRKIWRLAPLPIIAGLAFGLIENSEFNFLPIYGIRTAFTTENVMLLIVALAMGDMICQWFIGDFADRYNKRFVLAGVAIVCFVCSALLPIVIYMSPFILFPLIFIWGGATMGIYTVGLTLLADRFEGGDLSSANALLVMIYGLGAFIGPPLVGRAMDYWDPHGMAGAIAAFSGLFAAYALIRIALHPNR